MVYSDYNTQFVDKVAIQHLIDELKKEIADISTGNIDLSDYVTKSELQAKLDALDIDIDLSSYATKEELTEAINSIDLSSYATKAEIPSLDGYATEQYVDNAVSNIPATDLSNYYSKTETDNLINSIPSGDGSTVDLSNYYTKEETYNKTEVDNLIPTVTDGEDGVSPTIVENVNNDDATYKLDITDVNGTFTTPNLKGANGTSSGGSSSGNGEIYSTEEVAIGTWIDGRTIYRKVITMDLPAVSSGSYYNSTVVVSSPCNIIMINWRAICYSGLTDNETYWYPSYYFSGDGIKGTEIWYSKSSASAIGQALDKDKFSVFHNTNPTISGGIHCYYGSSFANKRCDFILEYLKVESETTE